MFNILNMISKMDTRKTLVLNWTAAGKAHQVYTIIKH